MASLLDPYEDLNIDLDDTVEGILATKRKKDKRSEYLLGSRLNPYSKWSAAKPQMADATEQSYRELGARNPMLAKDAIATSTPLWSTLEWFPGTGVGTKLAGMAGSVAALPLKSETMQKLLEQAGKLGLKTAVPIKEFMSRKLKDMGYKSGVQVHSVRQMKEPKKYGSYDWDAANSAELGFDPIKRKEKEDVLKELGVKLPPFNTKYTDNLRYKYRYWTDDEYRIKVLLRSTQKKSAQAASRREMIEKSGTENLPENVQRTMASSRVRSVIENMGREDAKRGGGFSLTKEEIEKIKKQLFPIKLKEIQEGTPLIYRMTIDHYYPRHGVVVRGGRNQYQLGSGLTTWKNITDSNGKLRLISLLENIQKSNKIPGRMLSSGQKELRKFPPGTSIMDL